MEVHLPINITVMFGDFKLIDLSVLTLEEIKTHKNVALLEGIMQQVYMRDAINFGHYFASLAYNAQGLHPRWQDVIEYVLSVKKRDYFKEFFKAFKEIPKEHKEAIMTLEEFFIEEGVLRGIEQGKHAEALEIAENMINEGIEVSVVKKVTKLNDQDLRLLMRGH